MFSDGFPGVHFLADPLEPLGVTLPALLPPPRLYIPGAKPGDAPDFFPLLGLPATGIAGISIVVVAPGVGAYVCPIPPGATAPAPGGGFPPAAAVPLAPFPPFPAPALPAAAAASCACCCICICCCCI